MKQKISFVCQECGYDSPKFLGKCPECGSWNSFKEFKTSYSKSSSPSRLGSVAVVESNIPKPLRQVLETKGQTTQRLKTGNYYKNRKSKKRFNNLLTYVRFRKVRTR